MDTFVTIRDQVLELRKLVIDDLAGQLRDGRLDLDELSVRANRVGDWFARNQSTIKPGLAVGFERLLRVAVSSVNGLGDYCRAALSQETAKRPSDREFQRHVESLWNSFLGESYQFLSALEREGGNVTNNHINISNVVGPVNVQSSLDGAIQSISNAPALSQGVRDDMAGLLVELRNCLACAPAARKEDVELVGEQAEAIAEELKKPAPRSQALRLKASGLIEAAKALREVVPATIDVAQKIAKFVSDPLI